MAQNGISKNGVFLAIDTSAEFGSVAVSGRGTRVLKSARNSEGLLRELDELLGGERPSAVVVALGPGSYTGIRIGLALAQGFAFSRDIPLVGIASTLARVFLNPPRPGKVQGRVPARPGELYLAEYEFGTDYTLLGDSQIQVVSGELSEEPLAPGLLQAAQLLNGTTGEYGHFSVTGPGEPLPPIYGRGVQAKTIAERKACS